MRPVPLIALASLKASPGVTTTCLALAAAWPAPRRLLVEADPAGGDLGPWLGLPPAPGLASMAAAARRDPSPDLAWRHAQGLGGGLSAVIAPAGAEQAATCLTALAGGPGGFWARLAGGPDPVIADCGRLDPASPALPVTAAADLTLLMVRPRVSELSHLAMRAEALTRAGARLALLLAPDAGRTPPEAAYPAGEIEATLGIPVRAVIPADPRAAADLTALAAAAGDPRRTRRLPLARAAASLAADLAGQAGEPPGGARTGGAAGAVLSLSDQLTEVTAGDPAR